ncbi:hypothetical protein DFH08DRAFT_930517 [Mycena albidolilacea]|uniref:Uncharacterized protein n=1 Tax=Mycena albidolilacea TaxID=1033008 RepID=A0AAD7F4C2_9AGAR|nr:hypothetical protein DFH08DRAFT_930517 [Mycena albidolilacea]
MQLFYTYLVTEPKTRTTSSPFVIGLVVGAPSIHFFTYLRRNCLNMVTVEDVAVSARPIRHHKIGRSSRIDAVAHGISARGTELLTPDVSNIQWPLPEELIMVLSPIAVRVPSFVADIGMNHHAVVGRSKGAEWPSPAREPEKKRG